MLNRRTKQAMQGEMLIKYAGPQTQLIFRSLAISLCEAPRQFNATT